MIEQVTIKNFKSFKDVTLKLGPLNIFIGANASGKSNFFDALRLLQGIGYGFTLSEILDGKPKSATSEVWEGIRGGSAGAAFAFENADQPTLFHVSGNLVDTIFGGFTFEIAFSARDGRLCEENLSVSGDSIYDSSSGCNSVPSPEFEVRYYYRKGIKGRPPYGTGRFDSGRPVLTQMDQRADRTWLWSR